MVQNKGLIFKTVPEGFPVPGKDIKVEVRETDITSPPPGGIITRNIYVSFDPYQRGRMRPPGAASYSPPFEADKVIPSLAVAQCVKSDNSKFKEGDLVYGLFGTEQYSHVPEDVLGAAKVIKNPHNLDPKVFIGALGMPGLTAYSSFYEIGKPKKGETIFISAASGAVGQLVGQLAKHEGLKVIGSVGDDSKLKYILEDLGFDGGFNYKKEEPAAALQRLAPKGIDIYYENVGGVQLEAAIDAMNNFGRIVACGMVSQYNLPTDKKYGVKNIFQVVAKRITMRGFIVGDADMGPLYAAEHEEKVSKWIADGTFKVQMSETEGIDHAAEGLVGMLEGKNFGKAVLVVDPSETSKI